MISVNIVIMHITIDQQWMHICIFDESLLLKAITILWLFSWMTPQWRSRGYLFWPVQGINLRQKELSLKAFRQLKKDRYVSYVRPNKLRCVVCSYWVIQIRNWLLRLYFPCIFTYSNQPWFFFARVNQFFLLLSGKIFTFGMAIGKVIVCCVTLLCQLTQNSV